MASNFAEFQFESASEKIGLVQVDAAERLLGWVLDSGSVFSIPKDVSIILSIEDSSVALTEVSTRAAVVANTFFHDRANKTVFLETSDSVDPDTKFIGLFLRLFFSNAGVRQPNDLTLTGKAVDWQPLLKGVSKFGLQLDNKDTQLGFAIEGSGSVSFFNDQKFWKSKYDKLVFENKLVSIFLWNRDIPITDAKLLYRGRIQGKTYSTTTVSFKLKDLLNELRAPVALENLEDFTYTHDILGSISARVTENLLEAKQRTLYGFVNGHRPVNIDSVLENGYPTQGTSTATNGSPTVTGASTDWPRELRQGDGIIFDDEDRTYTVQTFADGTTLTLSEDYEGLTGSGKVIAVFPKRETQFTNRFYQIAGHPLTKPSTTISSVIDDRQFRVADATDFFEGDQITIDGESRVIFAVNDVDKITLVQSLSALPSVSDVVDKDPVSAAFLDSDPLILTVDYTVDEDTGVLELKDDESGHPEIRIASVQELSGTSSFTSASRTMTGVGTAYKAELLPGDWIIIPATGTKRQVWAIDSDTDIVLANTSDSTESGSLTRFQNPNYNATLSVDVIGKSDDGTSTGSLLSKAPEIVEDILKVGGLSSILNASSFSDANDLVQHRLGLAIPQTFDNKSTPVLRDIINKVNKSVFGSLFQNNDFLLEYSILQPNKDVGSDKFDRADVLKFSVTSDISKIVKAVNINFGSKEFDFVSLAEQTFLTERFSSNIATHLSKVNREFTLDTFLIDQSSAAIFAGRWSFLLELAKSILKFGMKLQGSRLEINDKVEVEVPQLYEKIGSSISRKTGLVQKISRDIETSEVSIDDLANAFSRASAVTENDALAFGDAPDSEKMTNGYITDNNGLIGNDQETSGINLIW